MEEEYDEWSQQLRMKKKIVTLTDVDSRLLTTTVLHTRWSYYGWRRRKSRWPTLTLLLALLWLDDWLTYLRQPLVYAKLTWQVLRIFLKAPYFWYSVNLSENRDYFFQIYLHILTLNVWEGFELGAFRLFSTGNSSISCRVFQCPTAPTRLAQNIIKNMCHLDIGGREEEGWCWINFTFGWNCSTWLV